MAAPDALGTALAEWREQFAAMKAAIDELGLSKSNAITDQVDSEGAFDLSPTTSGDDVWAYVSDSDLEDESEPWQVQGHEFSREPDPSLAHDTIWLTHKCEEVSRG